MHELSLAEEIVSIVARHARGAPVRAIVLEIGTLALVEVDALRFALESVQKGTVAEGARIDVEIVEGRARCGACGAEQAIETLYDPCGACGAFERDVLAGKEFRVARIALDAERS